jgi:hypothetical protein
MYKIGTSVRFRPSTPRDFAGWSDDAKQAMTDNPDYFVWWYTAKSLALVAVSVTTAYYMGKNSRAP